MIRQKDIEDFTQGGCLEFAFCASRTDKLRYGTVCVAVDYGLSPPTSLHAMIYKDGLYYDIIKKDGIADPIKYIAELNELATGYSPEIKNIEIEEHDFGEEFHDLKLIPKLRRRANRIANELWGQ